MMMDARLTINAAELATALGVSTWSIYQQCKNGSFPIPPIHVGRRLLWPRHKIAQFLGADPLTGISTTSSDSPPSHDVEGGAE